MTIPKNDPRRKKTWCIWNNHQSLLVIHLYTDVNVFYIVNIHWHSYINIPVLKFCHDFDDLFGVIFFNSRLVSKFLEKEEKTPVSSFNFRFLYKDCVFSRSNSLFVVFIIQSKVLLPPALVIMFKSFGFLDTKDF